MARPDHGLPARLLIYAFIAATVSLTALPARWPKGKDSFPMSSYPMFSSARRTAAIRLTYAVGVGQGSVREFIPPDFLGNSEVLQARATLARAGQNRGKARGLCRRIAKEVAARATAVPWSQVEEIRIVDGLHDAVDYLTEVNQEGKERIIVRCKLARRQVK